MSTARLMLTMGGCLPEQHLINRQPHDVPVHRGDAMEIPVLRVFLDVLINRIACSRAPRISGSANRRISTSPAVGGGSSTGWPHVAGPFPGDGRRALRVPEFI